MEKWVIKQLRESLAIETLEPGDIDRHLEMLKAHSLKMVTFLARFNREFGAAPKIMDFIERPCLATLAAAQPTAKAN